MPVDHATLARTNTCVLLAPPDVAIGKNVTDAVRAGGWSLVRTDSAINAMATLCRLEQARRSAHDTSDARHMLLVHRDLDGEELAALSHAVRKHIPGVKVHEIAPSAAPGADDARPVLGRIGGSAGATEAKNTAGPRPVHDEKDDGDDTQVESGLPLPHEVSRDEIAMLLSDDAEVLRGRPSAEDRG